MGLFYHLPMNWTEIWGVLKWVVAALIAGFVGQFGKSLALFLMKRRRNKRLKETDAVTTNRKYETPSSGADVERVALETQAKTEKKRAKTEIKRLKKS